jgi:DNA-binding transcriptional LysR family regulator
MEHLTGTIRPGGGDRQMLSRIDLNAMKLFFETVNVGSINKAAAALEMPKSTISRNLRLLEQQLGTVLLKRGSRSLGLTETGEALYRRCERIVAELEAADLQTTQMQDEMSGVLRVSMPVFFIGWVSEAIADFARLHSGIRLEIEAHNRAIDVAEERFDVAINFGKMPESYHPSRLLAELSRSLYATPRYLEKHGIPEAYTDLAGHELIQHQYQVRDKVFPQVGHYGKTSGLLTPRVVVNHALLVHELVLHDLGIGLMPDIMCRKDLANGTLVRLSLDWECPLLSVSANYLVRRYSPLKTRKFLDHLSDFLCRHA